MGSGGGPFRFSALDFGPGLRPVFSPPNARFEVLCFVGYIYVILRPSCVDRVPVFFQKNFEIFHKQGPYTYFFMNAAVEELVKLSDFSIKFLFPVLNYQASNCD